MHVINLLLPREIRKNNIDFMFYPVFPPGLLVNHKNQPPFAVTIHDASYWLHPETINWRTRLYYTRATEKAITNAEKIIVTTNAVKK